MTDRHYRIGTTVFNHKKPQKRADAACATGGFYKSPAAAQTVDYTQPLNIAWDTSCLDTNTVDIYLYAPGAAQTTRLHVWENVYYSTGSYETSIKPKWWNSTSSVDLQLSILPSGSAPFQSSLPAGPVFKATYSAPSSGDTPAVADTSTSDASVTNVNNAPSHHHGLSKGAVAAAVLIPLLVIGFLVVGAYLRLKRAREQDKRKRWSEAIDKRMSTISHDWKVMTPGGANAAIRNSLAVDGANHRASSFSFGAIRPVSTVAVEGGQAGIGARSVFPGNSMDAPPMSQIRPGVTAAAMGERVSRVSFAADVRPSMESRKTVTSRAFHTAIVPPLPNRQDSETPSQGSEGTLSPTQTNGPFTLSAEDIQARLSGQEMAPRPSMDEVMPALRMMQTGAATEPEYLFTPPTASPPLVFPTPPSPTYASPAPGSSMSSFMPMPSPVAAAMSPDDMLRAYAGRRVASPPIGSPTLPPATYGNMRALYTPQTPSTPDTASPFLAAQNGRKSVAPTEGSRYSVFSEDDAYGGTA
ncbi:hypothetical protein OF83DRAFT_1086801 [Amylostereum chailletii]|nr:hypothetical protein OF83DRAFT_1086801 [Amylostereum chailletii]